MAVEAPRGCGYRKVGGLYLVAEGVMAPCGGLPVPLQLCPTCGAGIKQTRGWTWIDASKLFDPAPSCAAPHCLGCPVSHPPEKAGLLWIGAEHYATPADWTRESHRMGVSRRIATIPRGLKIGETWIFVAHPKAIKTSEESDEFDLQVTKTVWKPGIFHCFRPEAIEQIITRSQSQNPEFMESLDRRGIKPVIVPDDDPDHNPKAKVKETAEALI